MSNRAERSIVTGPMVFTAAGIISYFVLPELIPYFPGLSILRIGDRTILAAGEITLAVILFSDASHISLRRVSRENQLPVRLLAIGMPLAIVAGTLAAVWLTGMQIWEAAILATILAPTDASLGSAVVKSELVPQRIRQALNVESGLNDGLSIPFLMLFISFTGGFPESDQHLWFIFTTQQIIFGLLVGLAIGWLGGYLMIQTERRGWMAKRAKQLMMLSLAVLAWGIPEKGLHGNGFIAAFIAGSALQMRYEDSRLHMAEFNEEWGDLLVYFIFFLFGQVAAPWLSIITGALWLYGIVSLTLVRMIPVAISMIGVKLRPASVIFMGWFGPRGLASVVLGLIYLEEMGFISMNSVIVLGMIATVMLSVLLHGVSANMAIKLYARQVTGLGPEAPEYAASGIRR